MQMFEQFGRRYISRLAREGGRNFDVELTLTSTPFTIFGKIASFNFEENREENFLTVNIDLPEENFTRLREQEIVLEAGDIVFGIIQLVIKKNLTIINPRTGLTYPELHLILNHGEHEYIARHGFGNRYGGFFRSPGIYSPLNADGRYNITNRSERRNQQPEEEFHINKGIAALIIFGLIIVGCIIFFAPAFIVAFPALLPCSV